MAKIQPYDFKGMPQEVIDFKDEVTTILNFGKYATTVMVDGTPTWTGREGETVYCYENTAGGGEYLFHTYYYVNSAWRFTTFIGTT